MDEIGTTVDPRMVKFSSTNELLWSTDYVSPSEIEATIEITVDNLGRILATGFTTSRNLPGLQQEFINTGDTPFLQIIKLDPIHDNDSDGLLNYEEFAAKTDPDHPDSDNDGLLDGEEAHIHLTNPASNDSDGDGLEDKYELDQGYSATNNDTDLDGMLDGWEDSFGLDPTDSLDAKIDSDFDGLDNAQEFIVGTDPKNPDTDGDGMSDGFEVEHHLNPLKDDADGDKDDDFLPNKFEHDYGLNPGSPIETIIAGLILVTSISAAIYYILRLKHLNKLAKDQGYTNRKDKKETEERGFSSLDGLKLAETQGFKTKFGQIIAHGAKYETVEMMVKDWKSQINSVSKMLKSTNIKEIQDIVDSTTSPINLHDTELGYKHVSDELNQFQQDFNGSIAQQQSITNLDLINDELPFSNFTKEELSQLQNQFTEELAHLNITIAKLEQIFEIRKQWFDPWQPLLTLIQMTQDGVPIEPNRITEVIRCPEYQAENLIGLLLEENTMIGKYDHSKRIYTKGTNISQYIQSMLEKISGFGE